MTYQITAPMRMEGKVCLPASKSVSNRALMLQALAGGQAMPDNLSDCDDTQVMVAALSGMPHEIDIKAAGTAMRFTTAFLSATEAGEHVITGTERMRHRPIRLLVDALRELGADIAYVGEEGYPPLLIHGKRLSGGSLSIAGNVSSQYISALLMIGPTLEKGLTLRLTGEIISRPYIEMTLRMMEDFGAQTRWLGSDTIEVAPKPYQARHYTIESDWSAASYWYEMMALAPSESVSEITLMGLREDSLQGDSVVRDIFRSLGIETVFPSVSETGRERALLRRCLPCVERLAYDFSACPDLAQTLVVCCCELGVPFRFTGLRTLRIKETDRIAALKAETRKLGYVIHGEGYETLYWDGERLEPSREPIATYEDHRMAMAFAPAAFRHEGLRIAHPEVVSKSYPSFWDHLRSVGFQVSYI